MEIPQTMRALQLIKYGKPFVERTIPVPDINETQVLVAIEAASLNPVDYLIQAGKMKLVMDYQLPITVGNDFSGTVVKVGSQVTKFKVGDRVYGRPGQGGTLAQFIVVPADEIAMAPDNISLVDASAIPLTGLTSYQALIELGQLQRGQKVFIQAGSGGVGTMAIQIAKAKGAFVATTTSQKNFPLLKALGADQVIDYHAMDFSQVLHDYDLAFDMRGGDTLKQTFKILKPGGKLITINGIPTFNFGKQRHLGFFKSVLFGIASSPLIRLAKKYQVTYDFFLMHPSGTQLAELTTMVEQQELKPIIDKILPFDQVLAGYQLLESHHATGKIVIKMR